MKIEVEEERQRMTEKRYENEQGKEDRGIIKR